MISVGGRSEPGLRQCAFRSSSQSGDTMTFSPLQTVALTEDQPDYTLQRGDVGAVVRGS